MFGQQAISPQPMEGAQAKMMKYFMPGMFTVFMMWLPSGLSLYILVNTVLTMIHQWYINKSDPIDTTATSAPAGSQQSGGTLGTSPPSGRKRPSQEARAAGRADSAPAADQKPARRRSGKQRRRKKKT